MIVIFHTVQSGMHGIILFMTLVFAIVKFRLGFFFLIIENITLEVNHSTGVTCM